MTEYNYDTEEPPNLSTFAIVAYWVLCVAPHFYALFIISKANNWDYNNLRPWPAEYSTKLKATVPAVTWAKYEKLEAISRNSFEQFPLLIATIILGTFSGGSIHCPNLYVLVFFGLRVAYVFAYLYARNNTESIPRTLIWLGSTGLLLYQILKAGVLLEYQRVYVVQTDPVIVDDVTRSKMFTR